MTTQSKVQLWNRALQKVGARRIATEDEDSKEVETCSACYDSLRRDELRGNAWKFAIKRVQLAASGNAPAWGRERFFALPGDYLKDVPQDPKFMETPADWLFETDSNGVTGIATDDAAPLDFRYVYDCTEVGRFDPLFFEALAARMAAEIVYDLKQSTGGKQDLLTEYEVLMGRARRLNAIEIGPSEPDEDTWITERL